MAVFRCILPSGRHGLSRPACRANTGVIMAATALNPAYEIRFEHRPTYLFVYVKGERNSYEISRQYWAEIIAMLQRRRYQRVLVVKDIIEALSIGGAFTLIADIAYSGYSDVEFAVVDMHHHAEENRFEELVGNNRGLHIKTCETVEKAEQWLHRSAVPIEAADTVRTHS